MPSSNDLGGRVALVTGAARGIGRAIAERLAADGATVVAADIDTNDMVDHERIFSYPVDLADRAARRRVVPDILQNYGRLDILVNNAAYHGERRSAVELLEDDWDRVLAVNLSATAVLCAAAGRTMSQRGAGSIINIAAIQAHLPVPTYSAYAASKGGIEAFTNALAAELSPTGVRVNAILPGIIATDSFRQSTSSTDVAALLGRYGRPDELAAAVAFLAGDEASFITGAALRVDGGRSISRLPDPVQKAWGSTDAD